MYGVKIIGGVAQDLALVKGAASRCRGSGEGRAPGQLGLSKGSSVASSVGAHECRGSGSAEEV